MISIISGRYKGQKLQNIKSRDIRPTQARVKKSMLEILEPFSNKHVLDLFSGSGSLGIESLSRGANYIISIDNDRKNFNNIDWWVLNHASRDSTKSKLYHSFCLLERSPMQSGTSLI